MTNPDVMLIFYVNGEPKIIRVPVRFAMPVLRAAGVVPPEDETKPEKSTPEETRDLVRRWAGIKRPQWIADQAGRPVSDIYAAGFKLGIGLRVKHWSRTP
jgi:hypothetical protein